MSTTHGVGAIEAKVKLEIKFECPVCKKYQELTLTESHMSFDLDVHGFSSLDWTFNCYNCNAQLFHEKTL